MYNTAAKHGWESFLLGVPFVLVLVFCYFLLDEVFTRHKKDPSRPRRPVYIPGQAGEDIMRDPDGRPSESQRRN